MQLWHLLDLLHRANLEIGVPGKSAPRVVPISCLVFSAALVAVTRGSNIVTLSGALGGLLFELNKAVV